MLSMLCLLCFANTDAHRPYSGFDELLRQLPAAEKSAAAYAFLASICKVRLLLLAATLSHLPSITRTAPASPRRSSSTRSLWA